MRQKFYNSQKDKNELSRDIFYFARHKGYEEVLSMDNKV